MSTETVIQPKDGDVYKFRYSAESWERAKTRMGGSDLNWCFDGQLVYRDGLLCDTYWGLGWRGDNGRSFTVAKAQADGTVEYVCNLSEVEKIRPDEYELYADGDAFNLSHQHGCYKHFVKRIGAKRDKERQLLALDAKVKAARDRIESATRDLEWAARRRAELAPRIEAGEEPSI